MHKPGRRTTSAPVITGIRSTFQPHRHHQPPCFSTRGDRHYHHHLPKSIPTLLFLATIFWGKFLLPQEPQNESTPPSMNHLAPLPPTKNIHNGDRYVQGFAETGNSKRNLRIFFSGHRFVLLTATFSLPSCYLRKHALREHLRPPPQTLS